MAAATLAGNALGAGAQKINHLAGMLLTLEVAMMVVSGGLLFLFAPNMMGLFSADAAVIALGAVVLRMVAVSEPLLWRVDYSGGHDAGHGSDHAALLSSGSRVWGVRIVGTFLCTQIFGMGLISAWACMIAHNLLIFVLLTACYRTGRWKPKK